MAENKSENVHVEGTQQNTSQETTKTNPAKKTFRYGDKEYLIDDFLTLHRELERNFYEFARKQGHYDDASIEALRQAIAARINAIKNGQGFSADGRLDTDVVDNINIPVTDRKFRRQLRRDGKNTDAIQQDNTEAAIYYINKLMSQMDAYEGDPKEEWDIAKHGFEAYLTGHGYNPQDIFERYDIQDPNNPEAPRSFTQRLALLKDQLPKYRDWFVSKNFDLSKDNNDWNDKFLSELDALITNFDSRSKNINDLTASLRFLGSGDAYATAFTSDRWKLDQPAAASQQAARAAADQKKAEEEAKKKNEHFREFEDLAYSRRRSSTPTYYGSSSLKYDGEFIDAYGDLNSDQQASYGTYLGRDNEKWNNAFVSFATAHKNGTAYNDKNAGVLLQGTFINQPHLYTDLGDGNYLINDTVTEDGQGVIYNPEGQYTQSVFLGDYASTNDAVRRMYEQLAMDYANKKYGTSYENRTYALSQAEGGSLIPKHQAGSVVAFNWKSAEDAATDRAVQNGVHTKTQKAREQYIDPDNKSVDNPNAGLTAGQKARIGYAIADITSAVAAFFPGAGTVVSAATGLGSTFGNFISDWSDDAVTAGQMWRNLGMNLGMDVLGLVPGGGAASKMSKVVKSLKTVVPVVVALPGVASMLANTPEIAQSWKKVFDGDPADGGSKVTYQDYMNILQVLNVAAGSTNIARNVTKTRKMNKPASDKIAVEVTDKTGSRKALVLEGEDVKAFQTANKEGKAQEFINNIEGGSEFTINQTSKSNHGKFWGTGKDGKWHLFNEMPFARTATGSTTTLPVKTETMTTTWGKPVLDANGNPVTRDYVRVKGIATPDLMDADLVNLSRRPTKAQYIERKQGQVDQYISRLRAQAEKHKADIDTRLRPAHERVKTRLDETTTRKAQLEEDLQAQQTAIDKANADLANIAAWRSKRGKAKADQVINEAESRISALEQEKADILQGKSIARKKSDREAVEAIDKAIEVERGKIEEARASISANSKEAETSLNQRVTEASTKQNQLQVELSKLQDLLGRLTTGERVLRNRTTTHSDAYNRLANFKSIKRAWNDIELEFKPKEGSFDLDKLYKEGGTINRNKINKFLNYAKG